MIGVDVEKLIECGVKDFGECGWVVYRLKEDSDEEKYKNMYFDFERRGFFVREWKIILWD